MDSEQEAVVDGGNRHAAAEDSSANDDDDIPQLSTETFAALQQFYKEQEDYEDVMRELKNTCVSSEKSATDGSCFSVDMMNLEEDWQLSQFWYDNATAMDLASEVLRLAGEASAAAVLAASRSEEDRDGGGVALAGGGSIACVSSPTLYVAIKKHFPDTKCTGGNHMMYYLKYTINFR